MATYIGWIVNETPKAYLIASDGPNRTGTDKAEWIPKSEITYLFKDPPPQPPLRRRIEFTIPEWLARKHAFEEK